MAELGDAAPLAPIFATYTCYMRTIAQGGTASGQEHSELLVESVKEQRKKGVALFSYTSASCCFGDFAAWEEKMGKPTASPPSHHVCLEKKKHTC